MQPTVTEPNFNDAARATATAWVEGCRTSGWTNANCRQPKVPYAAAGVPYADAADFDADGATIDFNPGTGTFIFYRFVTSPTRRRRMRRRRRSLPRTPSTA